MQCGSEGLFKTKLVVQHPCSAFVSGAAICAWLNISTFFNTSQSAVTLQSANPQLHIMHVATFRAPSMLTQSAASQQITCCISSCFKVINVPLWYSTSEIMWLTEICKLPRSLDTLLPQCRCVLSIVCIKLAQKVASSVMLSKRPCLKS